MYSRNGYLTAVIPRNAHAVARRRSFREARYTQGELNAKHGPLAIGVLRNAIRPPCFSTKLLDTHSPSPVPTSLLVVKNGLKMLAFSCSGTPHPQSANAICAHGSPLLKHSLAMYLDHATLRGGINGIRYQIRKDLAHFAAGELRSSIRVRY